MSEVIVKLTSDRIKIKGGEYVQDFVRCSECKHWVKAKTPFNEWAHKCTYVVGAEFIREAEDYCSRGERKDK